MAKLKVLPNLDIISGFKGVIDFYVNYQACDREVAGPGIPCARQWPRSPGHKRAPAVEAQWLPFTTAVSLWNELSQEVKDTFIAMAEGTGLTGRDMFIRAYLAGLYRYPTEGE